jgi:8-oxo-dGTP diphosphatase
VPTRGIVELFFRHIGVQAPDDVRLMSQQVDPVTR